MAAVHRFQCAVASALHGNVYELVDTFVAETIQKAVRIPYHVPRVSHPEAQPVIAGNVHEDALRELREIRSGIESVAGAVLPGKLDFEATVVHEVCDLLDDAFGGETSEASLHEVRAAEGAGVQASFFDVHDAHIGRFTECAGPHDSIHRLCRGGFVLLQRGNFL